MALPDFGSFAGADIVAGMYIPTLGKFKIFGELSTITYSTHRELNPVRALGNINVKGYTRGPRTIAGSLVFTVFDRHVLWEIQTDLQKKYLDMLKQNNYGATDKLSTLKFMTDEIPPFDVVISMASEYQTTGASIVIYGIRIANEGQVMSIEDLITENTMQYVAEGIDLMEPWDFFQTKNVVMS